MAAFVAAHIFVAAFPADPNAGGSLPVSPPMAVPLTPRWWNDRDVARRGPRRAWYGAALFKKLVRLTAPQRGRRLLNQNRTG